MRVSLVSTSSVSGNGFCHNGRHPQRNTVGRQNPIPDTTLVLVSIPSIFSTVSTCVCVGVLARHTFEKVVGVCVCVKKTPTNHNNNNMASFDNDDEEQHYTTSGDSVGSIEQQQYADRTDYNVSQSSSSSSNQRRYRDDHHDHEEEEDDGIFLAAVRTQSLRPGDNNDSNNRRRSRATRRSTLWQERVAGPSRTAIHNFFYPPNRKATTTTMNNKNNNNSNDSFATNDPTNNLANTNQDDEAFPQRSQEPTSFSSGPTVPALSSSSSSCHLEDRAFVGRFWKVYDDIIILSLFTQLGMIFRLAAAGWFSYFDGTFRIDSALFPNLPLNCLSTFVLGLLSSGPDILNGIVLRGQDQLLTEPERQTLEHYFRSVLPTTTTTTTTKKKKKKPGRRRRRHANSVDSILDSEEDGDVECVLFGVDNDDNNEDNEGEEDDGSSRLRRRRKAVGQQQQRNGRQRRRPRRRRWKRQRDDEQRQSFLHSPSAPTTPISNNHSNHNDDDNDNHDPNEYHRRNPYSVVDPEDEEYRKVQLMALERRMRASNSLILFPASKQDIDVMEHYFPDGYQRRQDTDDDDDDEATRFASSNHGLDDDDDDDATNHHFSVQDTSYGNNDHFEPEFGVVWQEARPSNSKSWDHDDGNNNNNNNANNNNNNNQSNMDEAATDTTSPHSTSSSSASSSSSNNNNNNNNNINHNTRSSNNNTRNNNNVGNNNNHNVDYATRYDRDLDQIIYDVSTNVATHVQEEFQSLSTNLGRMRRATLAEGWDVGTTPRAMSDDLMLGLRDGFCGALSSFSSWNSSMVGLIRRGDIGGAIVGYILGLQLPIVSYRFGQHIAMYIFIWRCRQETATEDRRGGYGIRLSQQDDDDNDENAKKPLREIPSVRAVATALFVLFFVGQILSLNFYNRPNQHQIALSLLFSPFGVLTRWRLRRYNRRLFPIGTFCCNLLACALSGSVGQLIAGNPGPTERIVLVSMISGFAGSLSSVGAFTVEVLRGTDPLVFRFHGWIYAICTVFWGMVIGLLSSSGVDWADRQAYQQANI